MTGEMIAANLETALRPIILTSVMCAMQMELPARPIILRDAIGGPHQSREREVTVQAERMTDQDIVDLTMLRNHTEAVTDLIGVDLISLADGIADAIVRGMSEHRMIRGNARLQLALFSGAAIPTIGEEMDNQPGVIAHLLRAKASGTATSREDAIIYEAAAAILERTKLLRIAENDNLAKDK